MSEIKIGGIRIGRNRAANGDVLASMTQREALVRFKNANCTDAELKVAHAEAVAKKKELEKADKGSAVTKVAEETTDAEA